MESSSAVIDYLPSQIFTVSLALGVSLLLVVACAWLMKRINNFSGLNTGVMKVVSVLPLGAKERLVLVQVGEKYMLLGTGGGEVNCLHVFDDLVSELEHKDETAFSKKIQEIISKGPIQK